MRASVALHPHQHLVWSVHMVVLLLVFKGTAILFSIMTLSVYTPTNNARGVPFLHSLSSIYCLHIFWWWTFWPELTHWKRPWCWERVKAGGEGDNRGWDGWMASPIRWTWAWVSSGSWRWMENPGVLQSMGLQSQTRLSDWTELILTSVNWYLIVVLIWISLIISEVEYLLMQSYSLNTWTAWYVNYISRKLLPKKKKKGSSLP